MPPAAEPQPLSEQPTGVRARHDELAARVASRRSIVHWAHAGVATFAGLLAAGAAAKLRLDGLHAWSAGALGVAVVALVYAVGRGALGRRARVDEVKDFAELQDLRARLGLDQPAPWGR